MSRAAIVASYTIRPQDSADLADVVAPCGPPAVGGAVAYLTVDR